MRLRGASPIWMGLAASALLHLGLLATGTLDLLPAQVAIAPPPIEIQLQAPAPRPVALPRPQAAPPVARPLRRATPPARPAHEELAAAAPESPAVPAEAAAPAVEAEVVPPPPPEDPGPPPPADPAPPAEPPAAPNPLPHRIDIEYRLSVGPASGRQTVVWINEGDRYTLTSVAVATGLTRLFYAGSFAQTSRGRITPRGLQPEEFWDQRGDKHSRAQFDAAHGALTLTPHEGTPRHFAYEGEVQDLLSLLFQLALTAPAPDGQLGYTVFNGKKLRRYVYEVRGEEMLETALGPLRTLHLVRVGGDADRFEAWLAVDRYYLPVRVVRAEESGVEGELALRSIAVTE